MTTQSPAQSLAQSQGDTPKTDAVAKMIGRLAYQLKDGELELHAFALVAQHELDKLGAIERELNAITQSPAPSKEVEERIDVFLEWFYGGPGYPGRESVTNYIRHLAAELGKERERERANTATAIHVAEMDVSLLRSENAALKRELSEMDRLLVDAKDNHVEAVRERDQLKRELAEAQKTLAIIPSLTTSLNEISKEHFAISAAYQRQKDALKNVHDATLLDTGDNSLANRALKIANEIAFSALAETPDVALLERVVSVLSELVELVDSDDYKSDSFTTQPALALLSTLQPDEK